MAPDALTGIAHGPVAFDIRRKEGAGFQAEAHHAKMKCGEEHGQTQRADVAAHQRAAAGTAITEISGEASAAYRALGTARAAAPMPPEMARCGEGCPEPLACFTLHSPTLRPRKQMPLCALYSPNGLGWVGAGPRYLSRPRGHTIWATASPSRCACGVPGRLAAASS